MRRLLLILALLGPAAPAAADVTATYVNRKGIETIVEATDAGLARIGTTRREEGDGLPDYSIFRPDGDWFIFYHEYKPAVVGWDVFRRVIEYNVGEMGPVPAVPADGPRVREAEKPRRPSLPLPRAVGKVMLEGRPATVYLGAGVSTWDRYHWIAIAEDPKLRPLAQAFSRFFRSRFDYYRFPTYEPDRRLHELDRLMALGAPLAFGDLQLVSVSFDPIPPDRFKLPATPLTAQQYQAIIGTVSIGPASPGARIRKP